MATQVPGGGGGGSFILTIDGHAITFDINPESLEVSYPARTPVTQTLTRGYVEQFGPGVGQVVISGTTGYGVGAKSHVRNGAEQLKDLITRYTAYLIKAAAASDPTSVQMTWTDGMLGETFLVVPDRAGLRRQVHKSSPMLQRFTLTLTILGSLVNGNLASTALVIGKLNTLLTPGALAATAQARGVAALSTTTAILNDLSTQPRYALGAGETVASVAHLFDVSVASLVQVNLIRQPDAIQTGVELLIPQRWQQ